MLHKSFPLLPFAPNSHRKTLSSKETRWRATTARAHPAGHGSLPADLLSSLSLSLLLCSTLRLRAEPSGEDDGSGGAGEGEGEGG